MLGALTPVTPLRVAALALLLLSAACHRASPSAESVRNSRLATMDSATARRICQSPDSVIAGTRDCVLRDQGVRGRDVARPQEPRP